MPCFKFRSSAFFDVVVGGELSISRRHLRLRILAKTRLVDSHLILSDVASGHGVPPLEMRVLVMIMHLRPPPREVDYEDMSEVHHYNDTGGSHERKLRVDKEAATRHSDYNTNRLHKKYP